MFELRGPEGQGPVTDIRLAGLLRRLVGLLLRLAGLLALCWLGLFLNCVGFGLASWTGTKG